MTMRRRLLVALLGFSLLAALLIDLVGDAILRSSLRTIATQRLERDSLLLADLLRGRLPQSGEPAGAGSLEATLQAWGSALGLRVTLIDPNGVVVADSDVSPSAIATLENHIGRPEIREAIASGSGRSRRFSTTVGVEMSYLARRMDGPSGPSGFLRLAVPTSALESGGGSLRAAIAAMALASFLVLGAIASALTRGLSRPIERIALGADTIASGRYDAPIVGGGGPTEVRRLESSLERMRRALLDRIRELREERSLHETILSGMREGLLAVDAERRVILANRSLRRDLDLGAMTIDGRRLEEVIRHPGVQEVFSKALGARAESRARIDVRLPVERSFEVLVAPLDTLEGAPLGAIGLFLDVTRLSALERLRREFIADVSHELRTPLASLRAAVENLSGPAGADEADRATFLAMIRRNAERMQALLDDLTDLSLIETESITLQPEPVDLEECVADSIAALTAPARARAVDVVMHVPPDLRVLADRRRLDQILVNVIANGIKFNRAGGHVIVGAASEGGKIAVTIDDTGEGVPPEDLERIFQRFYRRDRGRSREAGGTGLGLAIVKHLMRLHGGSVHAENLPGGGTRIVLTFPAGAGSAVTPAAPPSPGEALPGA
ncbi:MAG: HAMP domain-containing protein [Acidobacteria bacterium]|nr:HAMP domain-containing protein [Acidobacteriota bacterium]